jgi:hypothetical protein
MIRIYGESDDLVKVEGCDGADEFTVYGLRPVVWRGNLVAPGGTDVMQVEALYDDCWSFGVGKPDENVPLPAWQINITQHPDVRNSVLLEIDAPEGTRLTNVQWVPEPA